jgi:thiol:disulfide interchange protein
VIIRRLAVLFSALAVAGAAKAAPVNGGHVELELVPSVAAAAPGSTVHVAVTQKIAPGWHTYWKNSGDAGQPTRIAWTLPSGVTAGEIVWPKPHRMPERQLMTYGYDTSVTLPVPVTIPASAKPGTTVSLKARVDYLVCSDICIPEGADLSLDLPVAAKAGAPDPTVAAALSLAPVAGGLTATTRREGNAFKLSLAGPALKGVDAAEAYFYPDDSALLVHASQQAIERGPDGLTLTLPVKPTAKTEAISGVIDTRAGAFVVSASPGPAPAGSTGLGAAQAAATVKAETPPAVTPPPSSGFLTAALFALLGGLLLNLMPCVFPVLSMKAASLAASAHDPVEARRDGLAFLAGVLATFLLLATVLIIAKAAGQSFGWGFQLQSPPVIAGLALLILGAALNLSGVFEVAGGFQGAGGSLSRKSGPAGAFFTGALAVVVGAPCTAPFMAVALGYALSAGAVPTLAVFALLGVGLAAPFVALSFSPALLRRLPRPGPWMDGLRRLLAFPMYATAAFMIWVFTQQTGQDGLGGLLAACVLLALALYLFGRTQTAWTAGKARVVGLVLAAVAVVAALVVGAQASRSVAAATAEEAGSVPYSAEKLAALRAEGKPVFVNFTAAWCVTCKVNERVALTSGKVAEALKRTGTVYMVGDWTRPDPAISAALAAQGRNGVPLYLVYRPGRDEPQVLPQILTPETVVGALE